MPTSTDAKPQLAEPEPTEMWAVVSDHPYYPSIDFFSREEEARAEAEKEIADMHEDDGRHDRSSVSVMRVVARAVIKTNY